MLSRDGRAVSHASRYLRLVQSRRATSHSAHRGESALHVAGGSGSESFGKGFFITVTVIPVGLVAWTLASSSDTAPRLTGFVQSFHERREELSRRHALHQAAREQAASDRHLFASASPAIPTIEVRHPEVLNRSSPWNVVAGQGGADLTKLMEHYAQESEKAEHDRVARIRGDGKVTTVYDDTTGGRFPSWVPLVGGSKKVPATK